MKLSPEERRERRTALLVTLAVIIASVALPIVFGLMHAAGPGR